MMHKTTKANVIFGLIIFCIGITIGKVLDWGYFELSKEISIIDALTLFVTIGLGFYITKVLEREVQNNRIQKDLYIDKISQMDTHLSIIEDIIDSEPSYLKITNQIHLCGIKRNSIIKSINTIGDIEANKLNELDKDIRRRIRHLKSLLTRVTVRSENIKMENDIIYYSPSRITEIYTESNLLKDKLFELKILINHS